MADSQFNSSSSGAQYLPDGSNYTTGFQDSATGPAPANASQARLQSVGAVPGGGVPAESLAGQVLNFFFPQQDKDAVDSLRDWRVRISLQEEAAALYYNNPANALMYALSNTDGLIFPYTPQISVSHSARYGATTLTHANYASYFYEGSEVQSITISGDFTVQNIFEGNYLMAAIHFLRSATKMFYGSSQLAGTPPPMVFLDGYGMPYFPHVPCVITNFNHMLPNDVDYVEIPTGTTLNNRAGQAFATNGNYGPSVRLPTSSQISITLQPVYSRQAVSRRFTVENFNAGLLMEPGNSNRGGFI